MRTYLKTHPWINFQVDLSKAPVRLWLMLGEAKSKCDHLANVPLRPETAQKLHQVYLAKGVQATTAIEGNTLTEEDVLKHIEGQLVLPPSKKYLQAEIDNVLLLFEELTKAIERNQPPSVTLRTLCEFNRGVLKGLDLSEGVIEGEIRTYSVGVGRYRGAPAEDCEFLLTHLCEWLTGSDFQVPETLASYDFVFAMLKAILAHLYIAWIHPFGDGNGRTARMLEVLILLSAGVPTPAVHLLSNHYNQTRAQYYRELERASASGGDVLPFVMYAVQGFLDGLHEQLKWVYEQQWDVTWRNYVYERFRQLKGSPILLHRRRNLLLDLSRVNAHVPLEDIRILSSNLASSYANKSAKAIVRDLKILIEMGLVEETRKGFRARKEICSGISPYSVKTIT